MTSIFTVSLFGLVFGGLSNSPTRGRAGRSGVTFPSVFVGGGSDPERSRDAYGEATQLLVPALDCGGDQSGVRADAYMVMMESLMLRWVSTRWGNAGVESGKFVFMSPISSALGEGGVGFVRDGERPETDFGEMPGEMLSASLARLRRGFRGGVCGAMGEIGEGALGSFLCVPIGLAVRREGDGFGVDGAAEVAGVEGWRELLADIGIEVGEDEAEMPRPGRAVAKRARTGVPLEHRWQIEGLGEFASLARFCTEVFPMALLRSLISFL